MLNANRVAVFWRLCSCSLVTMELSTMRGLTMNYGAISGGAEAFLALKLRPSFITCITL